MPFSLALSKVADGLERGCKSAAGAKDIPGISVYYATLETVKTYTEEAERYISQLERVGNLINWKVPNISSTALPSPRSMHALVATRRWGRGLEHVDKDVANVPVQDPVLSDGVAPFWMLLWALLTVLWIAVAVSWRVLILVNPFTWTHLWMLVATVAGARASHAQTIRLRRLPAFARWLRGPSSGSHRDNAQKRLPRRRARHPASVRPVSYIWHLQDHPLHLS